VPSDILWTECKPSFRELFDLCKSLVEYGQSYTLKCFRWNCYLHLQGLWIRKINCFYLLLVCCCLLSWLPLFATKIKERSSSKVKVKVKVTRILRPTVSRPVCLGVVVFCIDNCGFLDVGRPLWWEDGSVSYNCFWPLPDQSLLGPSPEELKNIFYCLVWDSLKLEGQVPVFISLRNKVAQLYPRREVCSLLSPLTTLRAMVEVF
jgi:hypothetical protein